MTLSLHVPTALVAAAIDAAVDAAADVAARLGAATPTPSPAPAAATGPGIAGFLVTFALVLACIPLFLSMTRKVRGVSYRDPQGPEPDGAPGIAGADEPAGPDGVPDDPDDPAGPEGAPRP